MRKGFTARGAGRRGAPYLRQVLRRSLRRVRQGLTRLVICGTPSRLKRDPKVQANCAGLIGCGQFVKNVYLPALNRGGLRLVCKGLLSNKAEDSDYVRKRLRFRATCHETLGSLLGSGIDSIIVTTPNDSHYDYIVAGLESGMNVFCEKPLTLKVSEARTLKARLDKSTAVLMTGFQLRFSDLFKELQSQLANRSLGRAMRVRVRHFANLMDHLNESGWLKDNQKSGGGVLFNAGIHSVNLMLSLFGEVSQLSARFENSGALSGPGEHTAYCRLNFRGGTSANLTLSYRKGLVSESEFKFIILCENSTIVCDFQRNLMLVRNRGSKECQTIYFHDQDSDRVYKELNHFSDCVAGQLKPRTDIDDYIDTACIIGALYESGGRQVDNHHHD
jgi:predicted dehydrogenase